MQKNTNSPGPQDRKSDRSNYFPDQNPGREVEGNSAEDMSPTDNNADEKVIVNEQREHKTVNAPSQTAVNASEGITNDEETIDNS